MSMTKFEKAILRALKEETGLKVKEANLVEWCLDLSRIKKNLRSGESCISLLVEGATVHVAYTKPETKP